MAYRLFRMMSARLTACLTGYFCTGVDTQAWRGSQGPKALEFVHFSGLHHQTRYTACLCIASHHLKAFETVHLSRLHDQVRRAACPYIAPQLFRALRTVSLALMDHQERPYDLLYVCRFRVVGCGYIRFQLR